MPHTSHNSLPRKREIAGEDGWTRIISPKRNNKTSKLSTRDANISTTPYAPIQTDRTTSGTEKTRIIGDRLLTVEQVNTRFEKNEKIWLQSGSWSVLKEVLQTYLSKSRPVRRCIIFGSGSFCGYRHNWIERWDVGFIQLAVFKAVADTVGKLASRNELGLADHVFQSKPTVACDPCATPRSRATTTLMLNS